MGVSFISGCFGKPTAAPPEAPAEEITPPIEVSPPVVEPSTGPLCSSEDIAASLTKLHDAAMPQITGEIETLNSRIAEIDAKMDAAVEIEAKIDSEISYYNTGMKEEGEPVSTKHYYWVEYTEEDCMYFDNKYYEVVEFYLAWEWNSEEEAWVISCNNVQVRDKETRNSHKYTVLDIIIDNLAKGKTRLIANRTDKSNAQEKSIEVLNNVLDNKDVWEIVEVSEKVYLIQGYGLGYGEQLVMGSWYYYEDIKSLEPRDSASMMLRDALTLR